MKQLRIFFLCLVAATLVTACGGDDKDKLRQELAKAEEKAAEVIAENE